MSSFFTKLVSLIEVTRRLDLKRQAFSHLSGSWIGRLGFSSAGLSTKRRGRRVGRNFSSSFERLEVRAMMALLNELNVNPPGSATGADKYQYIELGGSAGEALNNQYVVMLDGNGAGAGFANYVANLSTRVLGSNGLLMIKSPTGGHAAGPGTTVVTDAQFEISSGILSKNTVSFFLVTSTAPVVQGTDYDTNNDGTLDNLPAGFTILDSVGWSDGDAGDKVYGSVSLTQTQGTPDAASRIVGSTNTTTSVWFNGDLYDAGNDATQLLYDYTRASSNLPIDPFIASLTPGAINFVQSTTTKALRMVNYNVTASDTGLPRTGMNTLLQAFGSEVVAAIARPLDLISMQEVLSQSTTGSSIAGMLNTLYGAGVYAASILNGASTGSGTQGFVYNTRTLTLLGETAIGTPSSSGQPRQTIRAKFRPSGTTGSADFYVYNGHWKSADTTTDEARRLVEARVIRADADALGQGTNIFIVGDFNLYRNTDNAFEAITAAGNGQVFDPLNRIGNWHNNASFTDVLTQAPAIAPPGGLTGGGLDDRFDWQMVSGELLDGLGLDYRTGSYHTFGNNGSVALNGNINDASSTALPGLTNRTTVLNLLTTVSDHLPVVADFTYALQPPTDIGLSRSTIAENAGANGTVGTLSTVDLDAGDTFTYTLATGAGSTNNASFNISGSTLRASASLDFEAKSSYTVRIRTTDASGLFFEKSFIIAITNVNEPPTDVSLSSTSIPENAGANTVVGTFATTDTDAGNTFNYSLVTGTGGTDNASFTVTGNTLTANASLDFETKSSYSIRVRTTDQGGLTFEKAFTIAITNVNEAPVAVNDSGAATELGTTTGNVVSNDTDPDAGETATLVVEVPGTITTANGKLILEENGTYNYTANANQLSLGQTVTDSFTYKAIDVNGALSNIATLTITITGENDAPTAVAFSLPASVNEGTAATVTITSVSDVDVPDTFTYNYVLKKNGVAVQTSGFVAAVTFNLTPDDGGPGIVWTVEIQAKDAAGAVSPVSIQTLTVNNVAPVLTRLNASLSGGVGTLFTNTGTYSDVPADTVTLSADIGMIVNNGNGTWSWSYTPSALVSNQVVTITGTDKDRSNSAVSFTLTALDITPPTIGSVKVAGKSWTPAFKGVVDPVDGDISDGNDGIGFQIPTDTQASQLQPLPWQNVNTIILAFSEPVTGVNLANIDVAGVNKVNYKDAGGPQLVGVDYNSTTNEATLSFNGFLTRDKLLIKIGLESVQDLAGNVLSAYSFRLNVLPGDTNQSVAVNQLDVNSIKSQLGFSTGTAGFNPMRDLNGSGAVNQIDVNTAKNNLGGQLPPADPT